MRYFFIILAFVLCACHDQNHKDIASLPSMTGGLNELLIVLEEPLWKSSLEIPCELFWELRFQASLGKSPFLT